MAIRKKGASKEAATKETSAKPAKSSKAPKSEAVETKVAAPARKSAQRRTKADGPVLADARAFQRSTRQSPY